MSKFFSLNLRDFTKGFAVFVITTILGAVGKYVDAGVIPTTATQWKEIGMVALTASVAYIIKNLFTNSADTILAPEPK
jgi:hypothetical protein